MHSWLQPKGKQVLLLARNHVTRWAFWLTKRCKFCFAEFALKKSKFFQVEGTAFLLVNQQSAVTSTETSNISCHASFNQNPGPPLLWALY